MKKIPCLFQRDFSNRKRPVLLRDVTDGCEWVLNGEGTPTRKRDGTACMVAGGKLYRRLDVRKGRPTPEGFVPCEPAPDPITGHWPGWIEVDDGPADKWHREAWTGLRAADGSRFRPAKLDWQGKPISNGTYELCGPWIQKNPEKFAEHVFVRHGAEVIDYVPLTFDLLRFFLECFDGEGIVFHHPDGRMAKIRRDDYGLPWPP